MDNNNRNNNKLKEIRKKRGVKVDTLSDYLGISAVHYYDLEKGNRRLNEDLIHKIADFYNVTTDYILGRTVSENNIVVENDSLPNELKPYIDGFSIDKDDKLTAEELKIIIEAVIAVKRKLQS